MHFSALRWFRDQIAIWQFFFSHELRYTRNELWSFHGHKIICPFLNTRRLETVFFSTLRSFSFREPREKKAPTFEKYIFFVLSSGADLNS